MGVVVEDEAACIPMADVVSFMTSSLEVFILDLTVTTVVEVDVEAGAV